MVGPRFPRNKKMLVSPVGESDLGLEAPPIALYGHKDIYSTLNNIPNKIMTRIHPRREIFNRGAFGDAKMSTTLAF